MVQAMYSLHQFRGRYAELQDTPSSLLLTAYPKLTPSASLLESLIINGFLLAYLVRRCQLQRYPPRDVSLTRRVGRRNYNLGALVVASHCVWYSLLRHTRAYGSGVVVGVAIMSWISLLQDNLCEDC